MAARSSFLNRKVKQTLKVWFPVFPVGLCWELCRLVSLQSCFWILQCDENAENRIEQGTGNTLDFIWPRPSPLRHCWPCPLRSGNSDGWLEFWLSVCVLVFRSTLTPSSRKFWNILIDVVIGFFVSVIWENTFSVRSVCPNSCSKRSCIHMLKWWSSLHQW